MEQPERFRHEYKYICSQGELTILQHRLRGAVKPDSHAGADGLYHIRSIYFDDPYDCCVRENLAGINQREKWRIRAYNADPSRISLERKVKENDMIHKDSCPLTKAQFDLLISGSPVPVTGETPPLLNRFSYLIACRGFSPKVIVGYDRRPYVYRAGNVRITFDTHIFSSPDMEGFFSRKLRRRPVLQTGQHLLEVKFDEFLPDWLQKTMQLQSMQRTAFSKYYLCRAYDMGPARKGNRIIGQMGSAEKGEIYDNV